MKRSSKAIAALIAIAGMTLGTMGAAQTASAATASAGVPLFQLSVTPSSVSKQTVDQMQYSYKRDQRISRPYDFSMYIVQKMQLRMSFVDGEGRSCMSSFQDARSWWNQNCNNGVGIDVSKVDDTHLYAAYEADIKTDNNQDPWQVPATAVSDAVKAYLAKGLGKAEIKGVDFGLNGIGLINDDVFDAYSNTVRFSFDRSAVDKTALNAAIVQASNLTETDYTADSWSALVEAKNAALKVAGDSNASQQDVDNATKALETAQKALVKTDRMAVYRLFNKYSGQHIYTVSTSERDYLASIGWTYESVVFNAANSEKGGKPVYRLYNPYSGQHLWTLSASERDTLTPLGWKYENIAWYAPDSGDITVYRLYNPYTCEHLYTSDLAEYTHLGTIGWHQEDVAWMGLK